MKRYFIFVVSKDHVAEGVKHGFAQAGHGKKQYLEKLQQGDWIIYYSSKDSVKGGNPYQKFTAIGQVADNEPYQVEVSPAFKPWRRNINYQSAKEAEIRPLLDKLEFISNPKSWGLSLRAGVVEIGEEDFRLIAGKMLSKESPADGK